MGKRKDHLKNQKMESNIDMEGVVYGGKVVYIDLMDTDENI